jgi:hypothetical protein
MAGRHSSVGLEGAFWNALKEGATTPNSAFSQPISGIDSQQHNLSSAVRNGREPLKHAPGLPMMLCEKHASKFILGQAIARKCRGYLAKVGLSSRRS